MEIDVEGRCGAGYDEKAPGARPNRRNGDRDRVWDTRTGPVELKIPKLRRDARFPEYTSFGSAPSRPAAGAGRTLVACSRRPAA